MFRASLPSRPEARRLLLGTLLSTVARGLTLPFLFVYLHEVRGLSATTVSFAVGWMGVLTLVLAPLGGFLIDRFGARKVLLPGFLIEAVGTGSIALVHETWHAYLAMTGVALGGAVLWAGMNTVMTSVTSEAERQKTFGLNFTLVNLGIGIGGLISGVIVDVKHPPSFVLVYVLSGVGNLIPAIILLTMPHLGHRFVKPKEDGEAVKGGYLTVLGDRPFRRLIALSLVLAICGYAQMEIGFTAFSSTVAHVSPKVLGAAFACNALTIVSVQLLVLRWLEGRSRAMGLAGTGLLFAVSWAVLGFAGLVPGTVAAAGGVLTCAVIFSLGETMMSPVMPAITNALAKPELRGRYNAMGSMVFGVSGVIGPVSAGPLIGGGHAAVWVVLVVGGSLVASALAVSLRPLLTPEQDGRELAPAERALATVEA
ncbi:MFS transporter [Longispora sp. K20-0274]|uniref:MFS transporter n=1 Tax=Longispora sp. K20-0274 TaxID=3088255 RepID=UPI003999AD9A